LAVAFDLSGGTFRDVMVEDYKGGRAETPPEIEHQFELIRNLCEVLHIPVLGVPNFEADDGWRRWRRGGETNRSRSSW